jgi:hypothetical protein
VPTEVKEDISYEEYQQLKQQGNLQDSPEEPPEKDPDVREEEQPDSNAGESSDPEPEIPEEEPELYNGKPPTESQKRFKQLFGEYTPKDLAAKRKAAEEERAALESRLRVFEQSQRQPEQRKTEEAPKPETFRDQPDLDDYPSVKEWQVANKKWLEEFVEWKDSQKQKKAQAEAQQRQAQTQQQKAMQQIEAGRREYRDFDIIFTAPISETIANELVDDPEGYRTAYLLAKNPNEARRISALSPSKQLLELGRFMASNSKPQGKKNTQPLKTPPKLSSGGGAQIDSAEKRIREIQARVNKMR